ncbi:MULTISPECIES: diacylglycerol kinase [Massilia]|jgi:diacylglycerol kinase (ATP)|uniref:diacylglycerol kinase n=1 Tax=Massilia TaxID=149698 RepID=UPI001C635479|nr:MULTISPECIES: diacylglycerol kinase [Massilia]QYF99975.1 diacylglycerol kinase [Massilia sp. NP310]
MSIEEQYLSQYKSVGGAKRVKDALGYSLKGLRTAWVSEHAFRQELLLVCPGVIVAMCAPVSNIEKVALAAVLLLVLVVELLNSSVEAVVDRISLDYHPLSGRAKDLGSAAVFMTILLAALTWGMLFVPALFSRFF